MDFLKHKSKPTTRIQEIKTQTAQLQHRKFEIQHSLNYELEYKQVEHNYNYLNKYNYNQCNNE